MGADAAVVGQMDDAAALASPAAIIAIQSPLTARLTKDGAEIRIDKCSWYTQDTTDCATSSTTRWPEREAQ